MKKVLSILSLCLLSITLFGCKKNKLTKVKLAEVARSVFYAPQYVAINKGYFEEEGIKIDLINANGADKVTAALLSGDVQIGLQGPEPTIYLYKQNKDNYLINFAQLTRTDGNFIFGREKIDNFTLQDLKGKSILGGRKGGVPEMTLEYILKEAGLEVGQDDDTKDVNVRTDVAFAALAGSFLKGEGDFVTLFEPAATQMEKLNLGHIVSSLGSESGNIPYTCFSSLKSYHKSNPKQIQKFTNAIYKALVYVNTNDALTIAKSIQKSFTSSDLEELTTVISRYKSIEAWPTDLKLTKDSFDKLQEIVELAGELTKRAPYDKLVTTKYVDSITK